MFSFKPDYASTLARMQAFWAFDVLERPLVSFHLSKPYDQLVPMPESNHADSAERWLDTTYQTELALARLANREFLGDSLPIAYPNLGPEVFSALYGSPIHFGDWGTSWTDPVLEDWEQAPALRLDWDSPVLKKLLEMTDALLEVGRDRFIVGMPDWHPGGDPVAAFRDPQNLAVDLLEHPGEVKALLARLEGDYFKVYDLFYNRLRAAGQPITSWLPLVHEGKYYIPSNDFSIMISKRMFDEFFLPGIQRECRFLERSIYHLDGPGALRHLDSILAIPELNALQWVFGAGNEGFEKWVGVYRKAQAAGKGIQVNCRLAEIPMILETLDPRGLFLMVDDMPDRDSAEALLAELVRWTREVRP